MMLAQAEAEFTTLVDRLANRFASKIEARAFFDWAIGDLIGRQGLLEREQWNARQDVVDGLRDAPTPDP